MPTTPNGQAVAVMVAWSAVLLGAGASIAANSLHVMLVVGPTMGGASTAQVVSAAFWPVALILSIEVIARVAWPDSHAFTALRWGGVGAVAAVAAIVSYRHMHGLLLHWGEDPITALLGPIGVDGLVAVGTVALMAISNNKTARRAASAKPAKTAEIKEPTLRAEAPSQAPAPSEPAPPAAVKTTQPPVAASTVPTAAPSPVDRDALTAVGLSGPLHKQVAGALESIVATGRTPEPSDLAQVGIPTGMARKIITTALNGHMAT